MISSTNERNEAIKQSKEILQPYTCLKSSEMTQANKTISYEQKNTGKKQLKIVEIKTIAMKFFQISMGKIHVPQKHKSLVNWKLAVRNWPRKQYRDVKRGNYERKVTRHGRQKTGFCTRLLGTSNSRKYRKLQLAPRLCGKFSGSGSELFRIDDMSMQIDGTSSARQDK